MAGGTYWDVFWMNTGFYLKNYICFTPGLPAKAVLKPEKVREMVV